jgi:hypothetical protein
MWRRRGSLRRGWAVEIASRIALRDVDRAPVVGHLEGHDLPELRAAGVDRGQTSFSVGAPPGTWTAHQPNP